MSENLKDILSHLSTEVDQETLLLYLQGKLTPEKQHELEKSLLDNEFAADALEGLQQFGDRQQIAAYAEQLNKELKKKTGRTKNYRKKPRLQAEPWLIITLVIILLLLILTYFIIHKHLQ
jgi:hypothetical protein